MFSDVMLMKLFGLKRKVVTGDWKNCIMRSFITIQPTNVTRIIKSRRMS